MATLPWDIGTFYLEIISGSDYENFHESINWWHLTLLTLDIFEKHNSIILKLWWFGNTVEIFNKFLNI